MHNYFCVSAKLHSHSEAVAALSWIGRLNCFSSKSSDLFHTKLGRTDMRTDSPAWTDASVDVHILPGGAGSRWPFFFSCSSSTSQVPGRRLGRGGSRGKSLVQMYERYYMRKTIVPSQCIPMGQWMLLHWWAASYPPAWTLNFTCTPLIYS